MKTKPEEIIKALGQLLRALGAQRMTVYADSNHWSITCPDITAARQLAVYLGFTGDLVRIESDTFIWEQISGRLAGKNVHISTPGRDKRKPNPIREDAISEAVQALRGVTADA